MGTQLNNKMSSPAENYFRDQCIFLTGATGFLGLAVVVKILCSVPCRQLLLLVRGGEQYVQLSVLPPTTTQELS